MANRDWLSRHAASRARQPRAQRGDQNPPRGIPNVRVQLLANSTGPPPQVEAGTESVAGGTHVGKVSQADRGRSEGWSVRNLGGLGAWAVFVGGIKFKDGTSLSYKTEYKCNR